MKVHPHDLISSYLINMVSSQTKLFLVLLQLSLLCLGSNSFFFEFGHRHHHNHPRPCGPPLPHPTNTPTVKPPVNPPTAPPTNPPVDSPVNPPITLPTISPTSQPVDSPVNPPLAAPQASSPVNPTTMSPIDAPVNSPVNPPTTPPTPAPVNPLTMPPAETATPPAPGLALSSDLVAVQGDVYCANCTRTIDGAQPLAGATVVLTCMSGVFPTVRVAMTDKDGHFFVMAPDGVKSPGATSQCTVYLLPVPPLGLCSQRTDLNGGISGAHLEPVETFAPLPYSLFTVGPFSFEPPSGFCTAAN